MEPPLLLLRRAAVITIRPRRAVAVVRCPDRGGVQRLAFPHQPSAASRSPVVATSAPLEGGDPADRWSYYLQTRESRTPRGLGVTCTAGSRSFLPYGTYGTRVSKFAARVERLALPPSRGGARPACCPRTRKPFGGSAPPPPRRARPRTSQTLPTWRGSVQRSTPSMVGTMSQSRRWPCGVPERTSARVHTGWTRCACVRARYHALHH